jgi:hypothetical protein
VPAEHDDDCLACAGGGGDRVYQAEKVPGDEYVRECAEKRVEGAVTRGRSRKLFRANLVRPAPDRNGADGRQVGLGNGYGFAAAAVVVGLYDLR